MRNETLHVVALENWERSKYNDTVAGRQVGTQQNYSIGIILAGMAGVIGELSVW